MFQAEIPTEVPADTAMQPQEDAITWTASEYIAHHKSFGWYLLLALVAAVFAALVYFLTGGDKLSAAVVVLVAVVFGIYAAKQPKEQRYAISDAGITIGERTYDFSQFKSFAIAEDGPFPSITFMPLKRFMPAVSIYYDPQDEENIVNALSLFLPVEEHRTDMVDRLMKKIRF